MRSTWLTMSEHVSACLQEEAASTLKRKQPASGVKQRSIMEFFKTPPAQPAQKRSKVGRRGFAYLLAMLQSLCPGLAQTASLLESCAHSS